MTALRCLILHPENHATLAGSCGRCGEPEDSPQTKAAKAQASGILFFIAGVQVICGAIGLGLTVASGNAEQVPQNLLLAAVAEMIAYTALFGLLGLLARRLPLTASVVGLLIYVSACLVQFAVALELIAQVIIIKLALGGAIGRAVYASAKALNT